MPALIIDCPSCCRKLQVPDELLGKAVKCPTCEHTFQSTAVQEPPTPPSASPPKKGTGLVSGPQIEVAQGSPETSPVPFFGGPTTAGDKPTPPISAEKFEDDEEDNERPWNEPEQFQGRRDAEPHRGTLILVLGIVSIVASALGGWCFGSGGLIGLPLGIAAWVMGRRDLIKMRESSMDDGGKELTKAGWVCGIIGTIMGSVCSLGFLVYVGFIFTMITTARKMPPPPMPAPVPAPVRPPPVPAPGPPGDRAALLRQAPALAGPFARGGRLRS